MAQVRKDRIQVDVEINGEKVGKTIADLQKQYRQANKELRQLTIGSEEFVAKQKEVAGLKSVLDDQRKSVSEYARALDDVQPRSFLALQSRVSDLRKELNTLDPATQEYIEKSKELNQVENELADITQEAVNIKHSLEDIEPDSLIALEREAAKLKDELKKLSPASEEFRQKAGELKQVESQIDKITQSTKKAEKGVSSFSRIFKAALAPLVGILATISFKEIIAGVFKTGAEIEAFDQKSKKVFGEAIDTVEDFAKKNANAMGLTRREYIAAATAAGDLLIPMGFQREEAANLSSDLVDLSGALAEWSGGQKTSTEVSEILTKALLGEREQLKTLGISISEADVQQKLLEKGQKKLTGQALEQAKALATLELVYAKSQDAQTAFAENGNSLLRQRAKFTAYFTDLRDGFVQQVLPGITAATSAFSEWLGLNNSYSTQLEEERLQLNALVLEITNANTQNEKRNELLVKLQEEYPDFIENIDIETVSNEQLTGRLKEVNEQLVNRIILQRQQEDIEKAGNKAANARLEALRAEDALRKELIAVSEKYNIVLDQNKTLMEQGREAADQLGLGNSGLTGVFDGQVGAAGRINRLLLQMRGFTKINNDETEIGNQLQQERLQLLNELGPAFQQQTEAEKKAAEEKKKADEAAKKSRNTPKSEEEIKELAAFLKAKKEASEKIQDLETSLIENESTRKIRAIEVATQREIAALQGTAEQITKQRKLLIALRDQEIAKVEQQTLTDRIVKLQVAAQIEISAIEGTSTEALEARKRIEAKAAQDIEQVIREQETNSITRIEERATQEIEVLKGTEEQITAERIRIEQERDTQIQQVRNSSLTTKIVQAQEEAQARIDALTGSEEQITADRLNIEKERDAQVSALRKQLISTALTDEQQAAQDIAQAEEEAYQKRLARLERLNQEKKIKITQQVLEESEAGKLKGTLEEELQQRLLEQNDLYLTDKLALEKEFGKDSLETHIETEDAKLQATKDRIAKELEEEKKRAEDEKQIREELSGNIQATLGNLQTINSNILAQQVSDLDKKKQQELAIAGDNSEKRQKIEEKYQEEQAKLEEQAAKRRRLISIAQKAIAIRETAISTARSIMKVSEVIPFPASIPFQIALGALGASQIGVIATQKFEKGGELPVTRSGGGVTEGPRHRDAGIKLLDSKSGKIVGEVEGGEPILSRATYENNRELVDRLLYSSQRLGGARIYEQGGILSAPSTTPTRETVEATAQFSDANIVSGLREVRDAIRMIKLRIGEREAVSIGEMDRGYQGRVNGTGL